MASPTLSTKSLPPPTYFSVLPLASIFAPASADTKQSSSGDLLDECSLQTLADEWESLFMQLEHAAARSLAPTAAPPNVRSADKALLLMSEFRSRRARHVAELATAIWTDLETQSSCAVIDRELSEIADAMRQVLTRLHARYPSIALIRLGSGEPLCELPATAYNVYFDATESTSAQAAAKQVVVGCVYPGWFDARAGQVVIAPRVVVE
ncbi:hypothetical protein H9P43_009090 [Blastocladiella emersonii ATCC 22665]|nr:hypothetical protein H9P43_009090 [Blastocladiella emersonii ATCC 22665]